MATDEGGIVREIFAASDWKRHLITTEAGRAVDCWQNVRLVLDHHPEWEGVLAFDDFAHVPVKRRSAPTGASAGAWSADDDYQLGMWLAQRARVICKALGTVSGGVLASAQSRRYHPVREWLDALRWDETPRLASWMCDCFGARAGPYAAALGGYFLVNLVARIYEPGCIMRSMPVLEGKQDRGKSTALRLLVGDAWFSDAPLDLGSKDAFELVQGVWLYEIGEMAAFNRIEANRIKSFLSMTIDHWVPKYIRGRVSVPRQTCFAGTTNESLYLRDWTGNTRIWPIACEEEGELDLERLANMREQLFAEARERYRAGARRHPTLAESEQLFGPQQEARVQEHHWQQPIMQWLLETQVPKITVYEVLREACKVETPRLTLAMQQDVGRILTGLGWRRVRESTGARRWFYERPTEAPMLPAAGPDAPPY